MSFSTDLIINAIHNETQVQVKYKFTNIIVEVSPLVYGFDFLDIEFFWGYIPYNKVYYKFLDPLVDSVVYQKKPIELTKHYAILYIPAIQDDVQVYNPKVILHDGRFTPGSI